MRAGAHTPGATVLFASFAVLLPASAERPGPFFAERAVELEPRAAIDAALEDPGTEKIFVIAYWNAFGGTGSPLEVPVDFALLDVST